MAKIAIDIGHGSNTFPPDKGVYKNGKGHAEHGFNAKLGMRIKVLLEANGHTVILGQQPNKPDVPLSARTNLYKREKVDLVVSVHANANNDSNINGRCVFYWGTSELSKKLAAAIRDEFKARGYSLHGDGLHASKVGDWTDLHITRVNTRDNGIPAVLVEHGFMTGNKDFDLVFGSKQDKYIEDMVQADVAGIVKYLGGKPVTPSAPNPSKKSAEQVAQDISKGLGGWGNDPGRAKKLKEQGYDPNWVQSRVNEISKPKPKPVPTQPTGIVKKYTEYGNFRPNTTIMVSNKPDVKNREVVARYYKGENLDYHTVHLGNGYVWLQYDRKRNGRTFAQGYIPCRTYNGGKYGELWGTIK